jgi:lysophospholipase L1-like esterase
VAASIFRYVALGDSTGVGVGANNDGGYPERLYQRMKLAGFKAGIMNLAQSGATTSDLLRGPLQKAIEVRPALITLGIGTNDLWRMVPMGTFEMNLKLIADALQKTGARVVVSNVIDLSRAPISGMIDALLHVPKAMFVSRLLKFNSAFEALAKRPGFQVVDLFSVVAKEVDVAHIFSGDGFHPSAHGYDRWAEELWPHVEAAAKGWTGEAPAELGGP